MGEIPDDLGQKGISSEDMQTEREREDIGEKFKAQLPEIKRTLFAFPDSNIESMRTRDQRFEQVSIDESKLFVRHRGDLYGNEILNDRTYFAYNPGDEKFEQVARCSIRSKLEEEIEFTKTRRVFDRYSKEYENLFINYNSDPPWLGYEISIFSGETTLGGTKPTSVFPQYRDEQLEWLQLDAPLDDKTEEANSPIFESFEEIEELAQNASVEGGFQLQNEDGQT